MKKDNLPALKVQFGDINTFSIPASDYLMDMKGDSLYCVFKIKRTNRDHVQVG